MVDNLASGLYSDRGQCLAELIRNSLVASMPDGKQWQPRGVKVELTLVPNHPLCPNKENALVILDYGHGLTDPALDRYFNWLGTPLAELKNTVNGNGASQKGIGRLAALALNKNCLHEDILIRIKHGYYLLTRTGQTGDVRFVPVIPEKAEAEHGFETNRFIAPNSTEMGHLKNMRGSFTAIVIPTPVFANHTEIYEAVKWFLPREHDKMFRLVIGEKEVMPPPLEKAVNVTSTDGHLRARLGVGTTESHGAWLCDEATGLRVASCQQLGRLLPEPLWFPDLVGDIFAPNLLRYQNTARNTLNKEFMRKGNKEWQSLLMFLISHVAPAAKQLIERDAIRGDAAQTLDELVEMFNECFGPPEEVETKDVLKKPPVPRPPAVPPVCPPPVPPPTGDKKPEDKYKRFVSIKLRDETYNLYRGQTLHPHVFAQVSPKNPKLIFVNVRNGYKSLPETKAARREHCLLQILSAIGQSKYPSDPYQSMLFANEMRSEFLKK